MSTSKRLFSKQNPPKSIEEASQRKEKLVTALEAHKWSMDELNQDNPGRNLRGEDFVKWMHSAWASRRYIQRELDFLRVWIKEQRIKNLAADARVNFDNPRSLIKASLFAILAIQKRGAPLLADEITLRNALQAYLDHR